MGMQCLGMPMRKVKVNVVARSPDGFTTVSRYLPLADASTDQALELVDLERGDTIFFALRYPCGKSPKNHYLYQKLWPGLNTQRGRELRLEVYCGQVRVASIYPSRLEWLYSIWNRFAGWIQYKTMRKFPHPIGGQPCVTEGIKIPKIKPLIGQEIKGFARVVTAEMAKEMREKSPEGPSQDAA